MSLELDRLQVLVARQRQHGIGRAETGGADAHLADGLFDPAQGVRVISLVEMKDAHDGDEK